MKQISFFTIITLSLLGFFKQHAFANNIDSLTINEVLNLVQINSKEIKIGHTKIEAKEQLVQDAKNQTLPSLSVFAQIDKASNMPVFSNGLFNKPEQHEVIHTLYQSGANLYVNIYNGLKTKNLVNIAHLDKQLEQKAYAENIATVKLKAIYLFYDLYLQRSWIEIMNADIEEKIHEAQEIKHLYQKGVILESDLIRAELEISKRKMTLLEIKNDIQVINQQLNVLIGKADTYQFSPVVATDHHPLPISLNETISQGIINAYQEKVSQFHVSIAQKKVDISKSANKIQLGIVGSFQFANPQIFLYPYNANWYALGILGLKASYNISSAYHNNKKVSAIKIEAHQAHIHHQKIQDDIRTTLFETYHNYQEAQEYINIRKQNVAYTKENERIIKNAYFSQTALITDLLDANLLDLKARFELKQANINVFKTYYALAFAKGDL